MYAPYIRVYIHDEREIASRAREKSGEKHHVAINELVIARDEIVVTFVTQVK